MRSGTTRLDRLSRLPICAILALATMACLSAWPAVAQSTQAASASATFDIPAGDLAGALDRLSTQAGIQLMYQPGLVAGKQARALSGSFTWRVALERLLRGSGLEYRQVNATTIVIRQSDPGTKPGPRPAAAPPSRPAEGEETPVMDMKAMTVTGTRIRGGQSSSPVVTISQEEMRLSGHNSVGEAMRALPQNFNGGQNPGVAPGASNVGGIANQNLSGGSGINLRGLGPDATVTLLNGSRLPYDGFAQATDVAVIPVAAIDRIEILLDGASAIYGSDAVGGVANIILKRDYDGVELSGRYGAATDGGYEQRQMTAVAGQRWDSGGFLVAADVTHNTAVSARQRDYLSGMTYQATEIYPESDQKGLLFSGHQWFGEYAELSLDAFYTERRNELKIAVSPTTGHVVPTKSTIWGASPSMNFTLSGDWRLRVHGMAGRNDMEEVGRRNFDLTTGVESASQSSRYRNEASAAGVEVEGPLFALPGGEVRLSVGGGWRRTSLEYSDLSAGVIVHEGENSSRYGYGELSLPLLDQLLLNAAVRYENYDSFGATTTPKVGVLWSPTPSFDVRASWGRSFKAPTLTQQYQARMLYLYPASILGGGGAGAPANSQSIFFWGGDPDLKPETAETISVGFVARPDVLPNLRLEMNWFQVNYTDRVLPPIAAVGEALTNPAYAEFRTLNPGVAEINAAFDWANLPEGTFTGNYTGAPYDPANVFAIVRGSNTNAASDFLQGVDLSTRYRLDAWGGSLSLHFNGTWLTEAHRKLSSTSPEVPTAGIAFFPPKFKGRFSADWSRNDFTLAAAVNYIGGLADTLVTPNIGRGSMTTLDLVADYQVDMALIGDIGINLAVTNLLNEAPPFMQPVLPIYTSYDSLNYSALGRVINLSLRKRF
jgi:outer membrane receptor protein involved in Fe transport